MRKRYRVLLLAAIVAAFLVPVGFALSLETESMTPSLHTRAAVVAHGSAVAAPVWIRSGSLTSPRELSVPEGARLFVVGGIFLGLAAFMRRSV